MLKRYTFWLSAAILFQFLTAIIHTISLLFRPEPTGETEGQLLNLLRTVELDARLGFTPTYADFLTAMGASLAILLLFAGLLNGYLLVKQTEPNVMKGVVAINVVTFGVVFLLMGLFAPLTPAVLFAGLVFINLLMTYLTVPKVEAAI